ncbi:MAG: glycine cleavage system protein T [Nitrospirae bacterium]|nr:glycine cleavage system protein T [Nitrospirota bacterium]
MRKTPLYAWHRKAGARMIDFAGWDMPVYYSGILEEHLAVRQKAGLFDISHMGRFEAKGPGAHTLLQSLFTNNLEKLTPGRALYGLFCDEKGGVIDDLIIYQLGDAEYYICVNAVNREADWKWLKEHAASYGRGPVGAPFTRHGGLMGASSDAGLVGAGFSPRLERRLKPAATGIEPDAGIKPAATGSLNGAVALKDLSDVTAQLAVQGPHAAAIVGSVLGPIATGLKYFGCATVDWKGESILVTRTGYTGEDGYELYLPDGVAEPLWDALLKAGKPQGLAPIGLGARDSLRIEMGYPLYGHEISKEIGPVEAGLLRFVDLKKESFVGKQAIQKRAEKPPAKLCGVALKKDGMIRDHYEVATGSPSTAIGLITSGCFSPVLKRSIGLALLTSSPVGAPFTGASSDAGVKPAAPGMGQDAGMKPAATRSGWEGAHIRIRIRAKEVEAEIAKVPFVTPGTKKA